ncbi:MAG TPA: hypothetical protein DDZ39_07085 [Flavobacteriaceae bacterium]|jgi:hypothetical protein|nr:hypothetical protein [Flavobacteriaceae bacterium]HBS11456.1 hypothetical protein [Flavobacteriaceae bacterium]
MNILFKKRQSSFLIKLLLFTIVLYLMHSYVLHYFANDTFFFPLWHIYVFHSLITFLLYGIINYKHANGKTEIFNAFMFSTLLKMGLAILFLLPLLLSDLENKQADVFNFFIPYFFFLTFEVYFISSLLNKN